MQGENCFLVCERILKGRITACRAGCVSVQLGLMLDIEYLLEVRSHKSEAEA